MAMSGADGDLLERLTVAAAEEIMTIRLPNKLLFGRPTGRMHFRDFRVVAAFEGRHACATFQFGDESDNAADFHIGLEATIMSLDKDKWPDQPVDEQGNDELIRKATADGRIVGAALVIALNEDGEELIFLFYSPLISPGTAVVMLKNSLTKGYRVSTDSKN